MYYFCCCFGGEQRKLTDLFLIGKQEKAEKWQQVERLLEEMGRHPVPKSERGKVDRTWAGMMGV